MTNDISWRARVKAHLPSPVIRAIRWVSTGSAQRYDRGQYLRFSSSVSPEIKRENLRAWMTMQYHNIEKGLSLPAPRPGFGADAVNRLLNTRKRYLASYGIDDASEFATAALVAYREFNLHAGLTPAQIPHFEQLSKLESTMSGGTKEIHSGEQGADAPSVDLEFFTSRSSVRQFAQVAVDHADIEFAVSAAQKSPAVCNRQFGKVRVATDSSLIQEALRIQGGARGFGEQVPAVAVITTSTRSYWNAEERMQPWTDGGMFAMSFVLGLHARGLGSVCLNWSKKPATDRAFRSTFDIGDDEVIVMLVGFGHVPDDYRVAASPRLPLSNVLEPLTLRKL